MNSKTDELTIASPLIGNRNVLKLLIANFLVSSAVGVAMILIPWILVKRFSGDVLTTLASIAIILTIVFVSRIGLAVDKYQRKNIMLSITFFISIVYISLGFFSNESKVIIYLLGFIFALKQVYFNVFFTTRLALAQSLVPRDQFGRLNGWLEIENQSAAFSAGALALILLDQLSIQAIFIACGFMLLPATYLFFSLPTHAFDNEGADAPEESSREKKIRKFDTSLIFIIISGNIPFICVMLLDVIRPIFITDVLHEQPFALALSAMLYTVGAIAGGIYGGRLKADRVLKVHLAVAVSAFSMTTLILVRHANLELFYLASFGWGAFNALSRVAAQTVIMHSVENLYMGRFLSAAQRIILFLRVSSMILYAIMFRYIDYENSFVFLLLLSLIGPALLGLNSVWRKPRLNPD